MDLSASFSLVTFMQCTAFFGRNSLQIMTFCRNTNEPLLVLHSRITNYVVENIFNNTSLRFPGESVSSACELAPAHRRWCEMVRRSIHDSHWDWVYIVGNLHATCLNTVITDQNLFVERANNINRSIIYYFLSWTGFKSICYRYRFDSNPQLFRIQISIAGTEFEIKYRSNSNSRSTSIPNELNILLTMKPFNFRKKNEHTIWSYGKALFNGSWLVPPCARHR